MMGEQYRANLKAVLATGRAAPHERNAVVAVMDATERARLRALRETIPAGDVTPCCDRAGEDGHHSSWSLGTTPYGAAIRAWAAGPLDLLALARTALPALLDDADAAAVRIAQAERERDEARAEAERLRRELAEARAEARLDEREACAALLDERADDLDVAESYLVDVDRDEERLRVAARSKELRAQARAIRARGAGGGV